MPASATRKCCGPELEDIDGFVDNIRYRSLTRDGWMLSLSGWRDEKVLVRWRISARHHGVQEKGRDEILADYHLRVGQATHDSNHQRVTNCVNSGSMKPRRARRPRSP